MIISPLLIQVHMCRAKVSSRSCVFYNNVDGMSRNFFFFFFTLTVYQLSEARTPVCTFSSPIVILCLSVSFTMPRLEKGTDKDIINSILDVEDLVKTGKKQRCGLRSLKPIPNASGRRIRSVRSLQYEWNLCSKPGVSLSGCVRITCLALWSSMLTSYSCLTTTSLIQRCEESVCFVFLFEKKMEFAVTDATLMNRFVLQSRRAHNIELKGAVVIFDEAHNVVRIWVCVCVCFFSSPNFLY